MLFISFPLLRTKGTVLIYKFPGTRASQELLRVPTAKTRVTVASTLGPVLEAVAHHYSIIRSSSMLPSYNSNPSYLLLHFVEFIIYINDETDGIWEAKGYYDQVVKDNKIWPRFASAPMQDFILLYLYVTFVIEVDFSMYIIMCSRLRTLDKAAYSCPCENAGFVKSMPTMSSVSPWQLSKVVAYAGARGNCLRIKVCPEGKCDVNVIRGKRMSSFSTVEFLRSRTEISRTPMSVTTTRAFFTNPRSMEKLRMMRYMPPTFTFNLEGGIAVGGWWAR